METFDTARPQNEAQPACPACGCALLDGVVEAAGNIRWHDSAKYQPNPVKRMFGYKGMQIGNANPLAEITVSSAAQYCPACGMVMAVFAAPVADDKKQGEEE